MVIGVLFWGICAGIFSFLCSFALGHALPVSIAFYSCAGILGGIGFLVLSRLDDDAADDPSFAE